MDPSRSTLAQELFAQWRAARGRPSTAAVRAFSRDWEELLEAAELWSAIERREAEADVRALAKEGWLELRSVRARPHILERITLPLAQEPRWGAAFGFAPPSDAAMRRIREYPWVSALEFLRSTRINLPFDDLVAIHKWLARTPVRPEPVPIKERSLEIFGDEKRLDTLGPDAALFFPDRLPWEALAVIEVREPLAWKRGPDRAADQPILVLENAATWHSYDRWNAGHAVFSAVVYGGGNRFRDSVEFLAEIFRELGGPRRVWYFGDLDPAGLSIPRVASERAVARGLPPIEPHGWSYRQLLGLGRECAGNREPADDVCELNEADLAWLPVPELREEVAGLLRSSRRLAQEHLGWRQLQRLTPEPARDPSRTDAYITMPPSTVSTWPVT